MMKIVSLRNQPGDRPYCAQPAQQRRDERLGIVRKHFDKPRSFDTTNTERQMNNSARKSAILTMAAAALGVGLAACASASGETRPAATATDVSTEQTAHKDGSCSAAGCGAKKDEAAKTAETPATTKEASATPAAMMAAPATSAAAPMASGAAKPAAKPGKPVGKSNTASGDGGCGAGSCNAKKK
jgi:uncharacterized low-complexity protein